MAVRLAVDRFQGKFIDKCEYLFGGTQGPSTPVCSTAIGKESVTLASVQDDGI